MKSIQDPGALLGSTAGMGRAGKLLDQLSMFGGKLGLEAIAGLLDALGHPERAVASVLVAGTNGKGSTSVLLASIARAAGYRVGLFTSPHLERPEERIRIDGRAIETKVLGDLLDEVIRTNRDVFGVLPSYFEAMTAVARLHFARQGCDLAIMEVGLGGRLDATNACDPILSVITSISYDHQQHLGDRLEQIASEKAGILRPRAPAVIWTRPSEVGEALIRRAADLGSPVVDVSRSSAATVLSAPRSERGLPRSFEVTTEQGDYRLEAHLLGDHQVENLRLAVMAAEALREAGYPAIDARSIRDGVARCRWPGRLEWIELDDQDPGSGRVVVLDGAHNEGAAQALCAFLDELAEPFDLLFGCLARKQVEKILPPLARRARRIVLTSPRSGEVHDPAGLARLLTSDERVTAQTLVEPDIERALELGLEGLRAREPGAGNDNARLLLACGSLYIVGDLRPLLRYRFGRPPAAHEMAL